MKPVDFPESNFIFTKPAGMTDEQCGDLPVWKGKGEHGFPVICSLWEMDEQERVDFLKTGRMYVNIIGTTMPPIYLTPTNPFTPKEEEALQPPVIMVRTEGVSCPNCGTVISDRSLFAKSETEFHEEPDPHYAWDEFHKCTKCETIYIISNGT